MKASIWTVCSVQSTVRHREENMSEQIDKVITEFTKQADSFNEYQKIFSKDEYNSFAISHMGLNGTESVLEVAAGTCAFGRAVAPHVGHVTEFDVTEAMLNVGRKEAARAGIQNVSFALGMAEEMPFEDESFDVVMSRLAFHHFRNPKIVFAEMVRVLKPGGKLVIIDMKARDEVLRDTADGIERDRDPSHVRCLSEEEFRELARTGNLEINFCETIHVPVSLESWMAVTKVAEPNRSNISKRMQEDLGGGTKTGFEPYLKDGKITFDHRWMLMVCIR